MTGSTDAMPDARANQDKAAPAGQAAQERQDFLRELVQQDLASGRISQVVTRFPPEPNGYLHIGHAKSICLNFGIARQFEGQCNLRMDDTNPAKEDVEYVDSITADVKWLIAGWADHCLGLKPVGRLPEEHDAQGREDFSIAPIMPSDNAGETLEPFYASDYFEPLYEYALQLIRGGKAYVCDHTPQEVDEMRGAPDRPGQESHYRGRPIAESLDLFERMRAGEFPDGARVLRAKIDMSAPNVWLRDPILYRIRHASHHHTGDRWCIYPMYDFAHGLSDYIEGITHSICTLEFEVHRPLYEWILEALDLPRFHPRQREFARLNVTYTIMSKRRLLRLVQEQRVSGWDDPSRACGGVAIRPRPSATSATASGSPNAKTWCRSRFSNTASARTSTAGRRGPWPCCARSRWSSRTTPKTRSSRWRRPTTPRTRPRALDWCPSRG
jgi:glutaminyl-tRNA synthetase